MGGATSSAAAGVAHVTAAAAVGLVAVVALCVAAGCRSTPAAVCEGTALATDFALTGRVVTPAGEPLPGAKVRAVAAARGPVAELASATTDAAGAFALDLAAAVARGLSGEFVSLSIEHSRYASSWIDDVFVPPPAFSIGDIALCEWTSLRVRVTDGDAHPVVGASVFVVPGPRRDRMPVACMRVGVTDARGGFESSEFGPGPLTIGIQATGFADREISSELGESTSSELPIVVAAERTASVRIVDAFGAPVVGARAEVRIVERRGADPHTRRPTGFWRESEVSDPEGWIRFSGLARDCVPVATICAAGHRPVLVPLDAPTRMVALETSSTLEVEAVGPSGEALEIHSVSVWSDDREPSREPIDTVPWRDRFWRDSPNVVPQSPSAWRLTLGDPAGYFAGSRLKCVVVTTRDGRSAWVDVPSDALEDFVRIEARMPALARVSGAVTTQEGRPVSLRLGWLLDDELRDTVSTSSSSDGSFELAIPPDRPMRLDVLDDGWKLAIRGPRLTLRPGEAQRDVHLVVEPVAAPETVDVTVQVTRDGAPPGGPVLLALVVRGNSLRYARPEWLGWTNAAGEAVIRIPVDASLYVVPHALRATARSSWHSFAGEFPVVEAPWPWTIEPATFGASCTVDLAHPLD